MSLYDTTRDSVNALFEKVYRNLEVLFQTAITETQERSRLVYKMNGYNHGMTLFDRNALLLDGKIFNKSGEELSDTERVRRLYLWTLADIKNELTMEKGRDNTYTEENNPYFNEGLKTFTNTLERVFSPIKKKFMLL